jgi:2-polyprenyl-3-methyl-5-hydroxy-6-metoxy-1,4-benzoquinol methylase
MASAAYEDFGFRDADALCSEQYVFPELMKLLEPLPAGGRILDIGCGNGALAGRLLGLGYEVVGVDLSEQGIAISRKAHPKGRFEVMAADASLGERLGGDRFDAVVSTEVVEHLYAPEELAEGAFSCVKPGGRFALSTPYHGWLKNCALAVSNKFDDHVHPLVHGGHIKFFSRSTLSKLLEEAGFVDVRFAGAGRVPYLWKSMVLSAAKPG